MSSVKESVFGSIVLMEKHRNTSTPAVFTLAIAVRPAVLKFLLKKLDLKGKEEPFRLSKRSQAGRLLYHLLRTPQQDRQYDMSVQQYPQTFQVVVSANMSWLNGCRHLTAMAVHDFNRQVEDMIEEEFLSCLQVLRQYGVSIETKQFAKNFMELYGFTEDDFSLDMLIKADYRRRKAMIAKENKGKSPVFIPNCPLTASLVPAHG